MKLKELTEWVQKERPASEQVRLRDHLQRWCEINSGSDHLAGLAEMHDCLYSEFGEIAESSESIALDDWQRFDEQGNTIEQPLGNVLRFTTRPDAPIQVLFSGHYDTVYSADDPFQKCEHINDDEMRGPGVTDMKGGLLIMKEALELFETFSDKESVGWEVVLNPDEEIGTPGSRVILETASAGKHFGMVYECSTPDGGLVHRRLGTGSFLARVHGKSAHAGRDITEGRNAIEALSALILELREIGQSEEAIIINPAQFHSSFPLNTVPDRAVAQFNIRVGNQKCLEKLNRSIAKSIKGVEKSYEVEIEWLGDFNRKPRSPGKGVRTMEKAVTSCLESLGQTFYWRDTGGGTDGSLLLEYGLVNIDSLGARGDGLHSPRERILLPSLVERIQLTTLLLARVATGDIDPKTFTD